MYYTDCYESGLGAIWLESDGEALTGLWFDRPGMQKAASPALCSPHLSIFVLTRHWLSLYFKGQNPDFTPPLRAAGTPFREKVWKILRQIPYGETVTYGAIAAELAQTPLPGSPLPSSGENPRENPAPESPGKMSAQAVGGAVGHNPISIIIPCHRVVGAKGNLTGYGGGMDRKIRLLELEGMDMSQFFLPGGEAALPK